MLITPYALFAPRRLQYNKSANYKFCRKIGDRLRGLCVRTGRWEEEPCGCDQGRQFPRWAVLPAAGVPVRAPACVRLARGGGLGERDAVPPKTAAPLSVACARLEPHRRLVKAAGRRGRMPCAVQRDDGRLLHKQACARTLPWPRNTACARGVVKEERLDAAPFCFVLSSSSLGAVFVSPCACAGRFVLRACVCLGVWCVLFLAAAAGKPL
jgi:hypothetical protein